MTQAMQADPIMQQISILNLRINDMMMQFNVVMKALMDENAALKKENAELKALSKGSVDAKQQKTSKP